jgi:hypothetical protein
MIEIAHELHNIAGGIGLLAFVGVAALFIWWFK